MKRQTSIVFLTGIALAAAVLVFMAVVGTGGVQASSTNPPPEVTIIAAPVQPVQVNEPILITVFYTDPSSMAFQTPTGLFEWGDGESSSCTYDPNPDDVSTSEECTFVVDDVTSHYLVIASHSYAQPGDYRIIAEVCDNDERCGQDDVPVSVVPPLGDIVAPMDPVQINQRIAASAAYTDPTGLLEIQAAVWAWGDDSPEDSSCPPNSDECMVDQDNDLVTGSHPYAEPGVYPIELSVTDSDGAEWTSRFEYVVVYDPAGGFVTGGGWIDSPENAYKSAPTLTGKATFGFVSKYKKGASVPTGNTQFQFQAGDLNFHSDSYDWLVVNQHDSRAQFKGRGTINGQSSQYGDYKFQLWATDGDPDTFRIKIWEEDDAGNETVSYDNGFEDSGYESGQPISGGSIVVHTGKKK